MVYFVLFHCWVEGVMRRTIASRVSLPNGENNGNPRDAPRLGNFRKIRVEFGSDVDTFALVGAPFQARRVQGIAPGRALLRMPKSGDREGAEIRVEFGSISQNNHAILRHDTRQSKLTSDQVNKTNRRGRLMPNIQVELGSIFHNQYRLPIRIPRRSPLYRRGRQGEEEVTPPTDATGAGGYIDSRNRLDSGHGAPCPQGDPTRGRP